MAQRTHPPLGIFIQDRTGFPFGARLRVALLFIFRSRFPMPVSAFGRQKKAGRPAGRSADCSVHFPPHCRLVFLGVPFHLRFFFRTRTGHGCFMPLERSVTFSTNVWDWYEHSEHFLIPSFWPITIPSRALSRLLLRFLAAALDSACLVCGAQVTPVLVERTFNFVKFVYRYSRRENGMKMSFHTFCRA